MYIYIRAIPQQRMPRGHSASLDRALHSFGVRIPLSRLDNAYAPCLGGLAKGGNFLFEKSDEGAFLDVEENGLKEVDHEDAEIAHRIIELGLAKNAEASTLKVDA